MIAVDLISKNIQPIHYKDSVEKVSRYFSESSYSVLPCVDDSYKLLGVIFKNDVILKTKVATCIMDYIVENALMVVSESISFNMCYLILQHSKSDVLFVVDDNNEYQGGITAYDLGMFFANSKSISEIGGIIVISSEEKQYSVSQIAQIIEETGAALLFSFLNENKETGKVEIICKVSVTDVSSIVLSLQRYEYNVIMVLDAHTKMQELQSKRVEQLLHYLNI